MRLTILLGIIYLAILKASHPEYRSHAPRVHHAGIVWGSIVPHLGESA
jgi:hypothetical protein